MSSKARKVNVEDLPQYAKKLSYPCIFSRSPNEAADNLFRLVSGQICGFDEGCETWLRIVGQLRSPKFDRQTLNFFIRDRPRTNQWWDDALDLLDKQLFAFYWNRFFGAFKTRDIYLDYAFEEVMFRWNHQTEEIHRKFYGEQESLAPIPFDNKLYLGALSPLNEISESEYLIGRVLRHADENTASGS